MPAKLVRRLKTYFVSRRDLHNCHVYRGTDQSIPDDTNWHAISFSAQRFDTSPNDDIWAIGNPTRLTCRRAGKYVIAGNIAWATSAAGQRQMRIRINGVTVIGLINKTPLVGRRTAMCLPPPVYYLAVGDFVELEVWQNSGGALNVDSVGNYSPEFGMARVG